MATNSRASQDFVPIEEVRDGIVILKDGSIRAVVMASSVNLALKSYEEQEATIMQFKDYLNSLDFQTQITIQSRHLDISPYLKLLDEQVEQQEDQLLQVQTIEYRNFIEEFTNSVNIMTKNFFVVIPYASSLGTSKGPIESIKEFFTGASASDAEKEETFQEKRTQLDQRISVVRQGLSRLGVRTVTLNTEQLIELYYRSFNPGEKVAAGGGFSE